jgi:hypothetical protein
LCQAKEAPRRRKGRPILLGAFNKIKTVKHFKKLDFLDKTIQNSLPFKSLGSLRNVLVFERKAHFLSVKITSN